MHQFSYRIQFHFGHKYVCVFSFVVKSHYSRLPTVPPFSAPQCHRYSFKEELAIRISHNSGPVCALLAKTLAAITA